ncbi:hypothetical protein INR49_016023 [Caranx melampygus]|nr:hypothetical protein INR49_016023 [Caranx melampygus]
MRGDLREQQNRKSSTIKENATQLKALGLQCVDSVTTGVGESDQGGRVTTLREASSRPAVICYRAEKPQRCKERQTTRFHESSINCSFLSQSYFSLPPKHLEHKQAEHQKKLIQNQIFTVSRLTSTLCWDFGSCYPSYFQSSGEGPTRSQTREVCFDQSSPSPPCCSGSDKGFTLWKRLSEDLDQHPLFNFL